MRRFVMAVVMMSAMACDAEDAYDGGSFDEAIADDEISDGAALAFDDEMVAEADPMASSMATVRLVSWIQDDEVVSKVYCDDFVPNGTDCTCTEDATLTGEINTNGGSDKCVLCRWWQWENGTCALTSDRDVAVEFISSGKTLYTFVDDDEMAILPSGPVSAPASPWILSHCAGPSSCACTQAECSCGDGYLGFGTQSAHGSGTETTIKSRAVAQIRLADGMCE